MNNVCLNLIKNKKLFLLLLSSFSLLGFNYKSNNNKNNSDNNHSIVDIWNNFDVNLFKNNLGAFSHVDFDTGWNVLASDDNISNYVKSYNYFLLPFNLDNYYSFYPSPFSTKYKYYYFQKLTSDVFSIKDFLVDNKITTREYYGEKTDFAGYFQQYLTISFKLVHNTIFFKAYGYIYSGWCVAFELSFIHFHADKKDTIDFFSKI